MLIEREIRLTHTIQALELKCTKQRKNQRRNVHTTTKNAKALKVAVCGAKLNG